MKSEGSSDQPRYLIVTIDTEVDHDAHWQIADPPAFSSIATGIPSMLSPLFDRYGVIPTYLLSPEVIEDEDCVAVLRGLTDRAELGTHLHCDCIEPERRLFRHNMGGQKNLAIQAQLTPEVEAGKLERLTYAFVEAFGCRPHSFRAGRYGMSPSTLTILARLGYRVDSSVTPGLRWRYDEGEVDYRRWSPQPAWIETPHGQLLELPISIWPSSWFSPIARDLPRVPRQLVTSRFFERIAGYRWLRPSWHTGAELIRYARDSSEQLLVLMLHSTEIMAGASPYAKTPKEVRRILQAMEELFVYWSSAGQRFCSMAQAPNYLESVRPAELVVSSHER